MGNLSGVYTKAEGKDFLSTVGREPAVAGIVAAGGSAAISANSACLVRVKAHRDLSITKLIWIAGTQSGNYDIGIYDAAGNRLWSKGSTASPVSGTITETFAAVPIAKGAIFYVAIAADNATATFRGITLVSAELTKLTTGIPSSVTVAASFPLPNPITIGSTTVLRIPLVTIREA
jgi:hypothetical protein